MLPNPRWDPGFPNLEIDLEVAGTAVLENAKPGDRQGGGVNHCEFSTRTGERMTPRCERLWGWWYRVCRSPLLNPASAAAAAVTMSVKPAATIGVRADTNRHHRA